MGNQDGTITVVLKVDLHCEGCAEKVKKSVQRFEGVERVKADVGGGELTVLGKVDPSKLRDRLAAKTHKQVDLLRPANTPKKGAKEKDDSEKPTAEKDCNESYEKICKHGCSTVVLKAPLHCEDCVKRIKNLIYNLKGVRCVTVDAQKDLLTVTGKMDAEALRNVLKCKLGQEVDFWPKDDGGEKKEKGGEKKEQGGDKKEKGSEKETGAGGGGKEKGGEKETGAGGGGKDDGAKVEPNRASYYVGYPAGAFGGGEDDGAKAEANRASYYVGYTASAGGGGNYDGAKAEPNRASYYVGYPAGAFGGGEDDGAKAEANRASYYVGYTASAGGGGNYDGAKVGANRAGYYPRYTYRTEMLTAPELFSDENPNGCSVM